MKELCDCGKVAVWIYVPGFSNDRNPCFCEDCVSRGCSCNHEYVDTKSYHTELDEPNLPHEGDMPIKWIEEGKIWCRVDEQGREYPCCEYDYDEDGFDFDE